jgi:hypothetical protein
MNVTKIGVKMHMEMNHGSGIEPTLRSQVLTGAAREMYMEYWLNELRKIREYDEVGDRRAITICYG